MSPQSLTVTAVAGPFIVNDENNMLGGGTGAQDCPSSSHF